MKDRRAFDEAMRFAAFKGMDVVAKDLFARWDRWQSRRRERRREARITREVVESHEAAQQHEDAWLRERATYRDQGRLSLAEKCDALAEQCATLERRNAVLLRRVDRLQWTKVLLSIAAPALVGMACGIAFQLLMHWLDHR